MATTLRRRIPRSDDTPSEGPTPSETPRDESPADRLDADANNETDKKHKKGKHHDKKPPTRKRRNTFIFLLGSLFGILAAGFFATSNDLLELPEIGDLGVGGLLDVGGLFDVLPAGLVKDLKDLVQGQRESVDNTESFSVGEKARAEGLHATHPIVMIPGVISTGLESWGTTNVSLPYFRKRLWGSWTMMRALVMDKEGWKRHVMLDKETGLDPPNIKLRAAQGFDATDFFITGYWIWSKILENLAALGYDPLNSFTAAYDWRLSYPNLEVRDRYFTRLKMSIEMQVLATNQKAVLVSHSMGSQVMFYFFHWVASPQGGRGGDDWVDRHIDSWINVSGCMLGAVKDLTAMLSGEMRDTAQLNAFAVYGLEKFLSREERAEIFRAMPGMSSMMPMGGEAVWGNATWAPDDRPGQVQSFGNLLNFRHGQNWTMLGNSKSVPDRNLTVPSAMDYLLNTTEDWYVRAVTGSYSFGVAHTREEVEANEHDPVKWINPLETRLPLAPNLKVFCFYGVGKPTERAYFYRPPDLATSLTNINLTMDTALTQGEIDHGVVMGEGDGTVNLLSSGYMCNRGWKYKRFNPAGVKVTVVEMAHEPERFNPRGGPNTADHVDILGRQHLNELILRVAAGKGNTISDYVISNIREYAAKVKVYDDGDSDEAGEKTE